MASPHESRNPRRRLFLAALSAAALASPAVASGCGSGFDTIGEVNTLRVLGVVADKPYAKPGDEVSFKMTYYDGYVDPKDPNAPARNIQVLWLGGCFNPVGDQYYGCYASLAQVFSSLDPKKPPPPGLVGVGDSFTLKLPEDLITRRPRPTVGPYYGLAYVFFAACAGTIKPVIPEGSGKAGDFPLGCFDADGNRLGADSFVPGYTAVYAFDDGRANDNPVVKDFLIDGKPAPEGVGMETTIGHCDVAEDKRGQSIGCGQTDPYTACKPLEIDVDVDASIAEVDPEGHAPDGGPLREVVWVDYFAEKGTLESEIALLSDATSGLTDEHKTRWLPPPEPGRVSLWAVVHDARGGAAVLQRYVIVQ